MDRGFIIYPHGRHRLYPASMLRCERVRTIIMADSSTPEPNTPPRNQQHRVSLDDVYLNDLAGHIAPARRIPLGLVLGFSNARLATLAATIPFDPTLQIYEMLVEWRDKLRGGIDGPTQARELGLCLAHNNVGYVNLKVALYGDFNIQE